MMLKECRLLNLNSLISSQLFYNFGDEKIWWLCIILADNRLAKFGSKSSTLNIFGSSRGV